MSITLTNSATVAEGGNTIETDLNAAVAYFEMSYPSSLRIFIAYGNTTGQAFAAGQTVPKIVVTINLATGVWTSSNGLGGTLTAPQLTAIQNTALAIRNGLETMAALGIAPGVTVPWTTAMFV
jgi:hypothetical protein